MCTISGCVKVKVFSLLKGSGVIMARTKLSVCVATLIAAVGSVEENGPCGSMDELYGKVAKIYANKAPDGFGVLSAQTVKARIIDLVTENKLTLKTQPLVRTASGGNSKKNDMLNILNVENTRLSNVIETVGPDSTTGRVLSSILDGYKRLAGIVESLHQRSKSEESESESETVVEPEVSEAA